MSTLSVEMELVARHPDRESGNPGVLAVFDRHNWRVVDHGNGVAFVTDTEGVGPYIVISGGVGYTVNRDDGSGQTLEPNKWDAHRAVATLATEDE